MASDPIVTNRILLILIGSFESGPSGQSSPDDISSGHRDRGSFTGAEVTTQRSETMIHLSVCKLQDMFSPGATWAVNWVLFQDPKNLFIKFFLSEHLNI